MSPFILWNCTGSATAHTSKTEPHLLVLTSSLMLVHTAAGTLAAGEFYTLCNAERCTRKKSEKMSSKQKQNILAWLKLSDHFPTYSTPMLRLWYHCLPSYPTEICGSHPRFPQFLFSPHLVTHKHTHTPTQPLSSKSCCSYLRNIFQLHPVSPLFLSPLLCIQS